MSLYSLRLPHSDWRGQQIEARMHLRRAQRADAFGQTVDMVTMLAAVILLASCLAGQPLPGFLAFAACVFVTLTVSAAREHWRARAHQATLRLHQANPDPDEMGCKPELCDCR